MQGVRKACGCNWFRTKKELKLNADKLPGTVILNATSMFGDEYDGYLKDAPPGDYMVVGPSPYEREWYATIHWDGEKAEVE